MEICDLPNKEVKILVLRNLNELQENIERSLNQVRKTIRKQNEKFNQEKEIMKKSKIKILEWKNTMNEMKNIIESINIRMDQSEESELDHRIFKSVHSEANRLKRMKKSE